MRQAIQDGLKVRVGVILMGPNRHDAQRTHEYLLELGVEAGSIGFDQMRDVGRGDILPVIGKEPPASLPTGGVESARPRDFGGSAAVSYEGTVYPCIFSRHLPLGSIRESTLETILRCADPVASPDQSLLEARQRWGAKLSCWECQARSALLDGACNA